jgi:serine-type D-Ala-D-Ala carboxypeptidase
MISLLKPGPVLSIMHYTLNAFLLTLSLITPFTQALAAPTAPQTAYPQLTYSAAEPEYDFSEISTLIENHAGTEENDLFSGATLLIAHQGRVLYQRAFGYARAFTLQEDGHLTRLANPVPMSKDSIFDLASVTKVAATTVSVMHLVSENKLALDARLGALIPEFAQTDKADITVRQLLTHRSGLWQWQPTWLYMHSKADIVDYIAGLPLRYAPGERRAYSDLGFMLLGKIIEKVAGMPLDDFVQQHIYRPLAMKDTGYRPAEAPGKRIVATSHGNPFEQKMVATGKPYPLAQPLPETPFSAYRDYTLVGEANDGNAWYGLQGVAGHAGLFSTAADLAVLGQALLNGGGYGNYRLTDRETLQSFLQTPYDDNQALGFRKNTDEKAVSYWHPGFTGTHFLIQPEGDLIIILLTNRQHKGLNADNGRYPNLNPIWQQLVRLVTKAVVRKEH